MDVLKIRPAEMSDHAALSALYNVLFESSAAQQPDHYKTSDAAAYVAKSIRDEDRDILLAEVDGAPAGFVTVMEGETPPFDSVVPHRYCVLVDLAVWPQYRSRGTGAALVEAAKQWAVGRELEYVELTVLAGNEAAQKLYRREGFEEASVTMRCPLPPAMPTILN